MRSATAILGKRKLLGRIEMSKTFIEVGALLLLVSGNVSIGQVAPGTGGKPQTAPSHYPEATATAPPSAEETVAYINKTLHQYPTARFSQNDSCEGFEYEVSISEDRKSVIIKNRVPVGDCRTVQVETLPVADLELGTPNTAASVGYVGGWQHDFPGKRFFIQCQDKSKCISQAFLHKDGLGDPNGHSVADLTVSAPDEVCERVGRAIRHLVLLLRSDAGDDPFARPASPSS